MLFCMKLILNVSLHLPFTHYTAWQLHRQLHLQHMCLFLRLIVLFIEASSNVHNQFQPSRILHNCIATGIGTNFSSDNTNGARNACAEDCSHLVYVLVLAAVELSAVQRINSNKISANEILCNKYTFLQLRSLSNLLQTRTLPAVLSRIQRFSENIEPGEKALSAGHN